MKNKYFRISREKEFEDIGTLIEMLRPIVTEKTVIVNCTPDFSSMISQRAIHSFFNDPIQMTNFEMPYPNTPFEEVYPVYCKEFAQNLEPNTHYVFIDSGILRGRNFKTLHDNLELYAHKSTSYDFACLYCQDDAIFNADYCVEVFSREDDGMLLFWWENENSNVFGDLN